MATGANRSLRLRRLSGTPAFNALYADEAMADTFKVLLAALIFTFTGNSFASHPTQSVEAADRAAIKAVLDAHGAAWTRGDVVAASATLTEDADWVSGSGTVLVGRDAIATMHREMLWRASKGDEAFPPRHFQQSFHYARSGGSRWG